jgi:hypothetical protein
MAAEREKIKSGHLKLPDRRFSYDHFNKELLEDFLLVLHQQNDANMSGCTGNHQVYYIILLHGVISFDRNCEVHIASI